VRYRFFQERRTTIAAAALAGAVAAADGGLADGDAAVEPPTVADRVGEVDEIALDQRIGGVLVVKVLGERKGLWTLALEVADVEAEESAPQVEESSLDADLSRDMAGEVLASMERSGAIAEVVFPQKMSQRARLAWKDLLARWQVVLPADPSSDEWTAIEHDTTGTYLAAYRRETDGDKVVVTKSKGEYSEVPASRGDGRGRVVGKPTNLASRAQSGGTATIVLDPRPASVDGDEWLAVADGALGQTVTSTARFRFERVGLERRQYGSIAARCERRLANATGTDLGPDGVPVEPALSNDEEVPDVGTILAGIASTLASSGIATSEAVEWMAQLVAAIERDPQAVDTVLDALRAPGASDDLASLLIGALGAAGTDAAQMGLDTIILEDGWPTGRRETALFAYAQVESPHDAIDPILEDLWLERNELWNTALLLSGGLGGKVRDSHPARFDAIEARLLDVVRQPDLDDNERAAALEAIGNLGPRETPWEVVDLYRDDASVRIRAAAVHALRRTADDTARNILLAALERDPSERVRANAAKALAQQPGLVDAQALRDVFDREKSPRVREALLMGLGRRQEIDTEARELIAAVASDDSEESVREYAGRLLQ